MQSARMGHSPCPVPGTARMSVLKDVVMLVLATGTVCVCTHPQESRICPTQGPKTCPMAMAGERGKKTETPTGSRSHGCVHSSWHHLHKECGGEGTPTG